MKCIGADVCDPTLLIHRAPQEVFDHRTRSARRRSAKGPLPSPAEFLEELVGRLTQRGARKHARAGIEQAEFF